MIKKLLVYKSSRILFIIFTSVFILFLIVGYFYYNNEKNYLLSAEAKNLGSISSLKENQILSWFNERMDEARYLNENDFFNKTVCSFYLKKDKEDSLATYHSIYPIYKNHGYQSVYIIDKNNRYLINLNHGYYPDSQELSLVDSSLSLGKITVSDIKRNVSAGQLYYDIIVPIKLNDVPVIAIVLNINPEFVIFPYVNLSYVRTKSRESFIFKKDNDSILFVSQVRFNPSPPLSLKFPAMRGDILTKTAVQGTKKIITGNDYRGVKVLADIRNIPGTPWYIVTKQDISEILGSLNFNLISVGTIILLIFGLSSVLILFFDNKQNFANLKKIQESEIKYSELVEQASDGILVFDKDYNIKEVNSFACQELGYSRSELLSLTVMQILVPDELAENPLMIDELLSGKVIHSERNLLKKDGTFIPCDIISKKISSGNILSIARDIADKKKNEVQIKNSERKFRTLFEKTNDAIFIMNDLRIVDCNPATEKIFNIDKNEIIGKTPVELSPEKQPDGRLSKEKAADLINKVSKGEPQRFEWVNLQNNKPFYVEVNLSLFQLDEKPLKIAVIRDITERKKFEEELIAAKEKAEEMNRLKSSFLANMSHELRTPLVGILGYSEILSEEIKDPEQSKMVKDISNSGKRLLETLNSILDLSRIESNKFEIRQSNFNLVSLVHEEIELYKGIAQIKNIYLNVRMSRHELMINSDRKIVQNTISHLINNAVKFTLKGGVVISLTTENNGNEYAVIKVIDTGIGIPEESQHLIFEEFRQASEGLSRKFEGSGLGLTITKKYISLLKGTIELKSKPGVGSEFSVRIPTNLNLQSGSSDS